MLGSRYRLANLEDHLEIKLGDLENNIKRCKMHVLVQSKKKREIMHY